MMVEVSFSYKLLFGVFVFLMLYSLAVSELMSFDSLTPYVHNHGSRLNHRAIRECHEKELGLSPYELYPSQQSLNISLPFVMVKRFVEEIRTVQGAKIIRGHYAVVSNPMKTVSVLEPSQPGGCNLNARQTVTETAAKQKNCVIAINAGYFNTKNGECLGNVVSNGRKAHDSGGVQNAHFGIKTDGTIFTGYISNEELQNGSGHFLQLVGGVIWLVRNGSYYVNTSRFLECESTEETGTMDAFVNILSARMAVGHDSSGRVVIVHVEGKSAIDGISLWEFQELLRKHDVVNAINLDGGGSSTFVVNGTVVNYPYDECPGSDFSCERNVSTVLCIHPPDCEPMDCNGHGQCVMVNCLCNANWLPPFCDQLFCGSSNCSNHGSCTEGGCVCDLGYFGNECDKVCPEGWYGFECKNRCNCLNNAVCDPESGFCKCQPGFTGKECGSVCPRGYYGQDCESLCPCEDLCFCNPTDGSCNIESNRSIYAVGECLAKNIIKQKLMDASGEQRKMHIIIVILSVMTAVSVASCVLIIFYSCSCYCTSKKSLCSKNRKQKYRNLSSVVADITLSDSDDDDTLPMTVVTK